MDDQAGDQEKKEKAVIIDLQTHRNIRTLIGYAQQRAAMIRQVESACPGLWHQTENEILRETLQAQKTALRAESQAALRLSQRFGIASMAGAGLIGSAIGIGIGMKYEPQTATLLSYAALTGMMAVMTGMGVYGWRAIRQDPPAVLTPDIHELTRQRVVAKLSAPKP